MNKAFEKILERLEVDEKHTFDGCINKRYAKQIVQEIAEEYNNGWISCSEIDKLPKDGTPVLVQDYEDYYEVYYCETKRGMKGFSDGDGWSSPNNYKAWQPLPEPYQPKGE